MIATSDHRNNKYRDVTLPMAVIVIAHLFLFIPVTLYLGNADEFVTPLWGMLRLLSIPALVLFLLLFILGKIFRGELRRLHAILIAVIGLLIWFQSSILNWDYGILDGRGIDWSKYIWRGWLDLAIWIGAIFCGVAFYRRIGSIIVQLACAVFAIQFATIVYSGIENSDKLAKSKTGLRSSKSTLQEIYKFSSKNNIVHLMLDGFQADVFEELIGNKHVGKKYRMAFSGFEFYNETLGTFPYTRFAVPAFLSGKIYQNDVPKNEFITSVIKGKNILNTASQFGYEVDIASGPLLGSWYANSNHKNSYVIPSSGSIDSESDNATKLLDLTLFRAVPHFIKKYVYNNQSWLLNAAFAGQEYLQHRYFSHTGFMIGLIENITIDRASPVYKYIHIMNVHNPMVVTPDCRYAGSTMRATRVRLTVQSKCTLDTIVKLFDKMKALGVYDNALIVVHADHGGWAIPYRFKQILYWSSGEVITPFAASLASPLLAIKPPNSTKGDLKVSPVLASLTDIPDTISSIMKWGVDFGGESILELDAKAPRQRKFYYYTWQRDAWESEYTGPIQEFIIKGSHYETPWYAGRVIPPPLDRN